MIRICVLFQAYQDFLLEGMEEKLLDVDFDQRHRDPRAVEIQISVEVDLAHL